ncbi:hypothetical protein JG687_00016761 [Phytophthora cactorum]|nr:hypothetical protein JG687_00016761 [Phytophthora cactorum]
MCLDDPACQVSPSGGRSHVVLACLLAAMLQVLALLELRSFDTRSSGDHPCRTRGKLGGQLLARKTSAPSDTQDTIVAS